MRTRANDTNEDLTMAKFENGHTLGKQFGRDIDPREAQAKGAEAKRLKKSRREAILKAIKDQPLTADLAATTDALLLNATNAELKAISTNEDLPTDVRRRARLLLGNDDELAMKTAEVMRNRAFGKPIQAVAVENTTPPPPSTIIKTYTE